MQLHLPQTNDGEIDFDFMETFIREIKEENMCKLSAYLTTTGLSDYTLTESESNALRTIDSLEWREFKVEKLFGKSTRGKRLKSDDRTEENKKESRKEDHNYINNSTDAWCNRVFRVGDLQGSGNHFLSHQQYQ